MDIYTYFKNIIIVSKNRFRQICRFKKQIHYGYTVPTHGKFISQIK